MPRRVRLLGCLLVAAGVPLATAGGCDSGGTECTCNPSGLTITIPAALVGEVTAIAPSGEACAGAVVEPSPGSARGATSFRVEPTQPGSCHLDIDFSDGTTFSDDLTVVETTGCCGGLRTTPPGAADIEVPAPDDAGLGG